MVGYLNSKKEIAYVKPLIPVKNAINGLETFINFFEQQKNNEKFKIDDLRIFRKYLSVVRLMEPKIQRSIHAYFEKKDN
jgi:hypothetical protein